MTKDEPTYDLGEIQYLIDERQRIVTGKARGTAHSLGFSETEIYDEVLALQMNEFHHSVEGDRDGIYQDVYKKRIRNIPIYIKFKKIGKYGDKVQVLSFKRDENAQ